MDSTVSTVQAGGGGVKRFLDSFWVFVPIDHLQKVTFRPKFKMWWNRRNLQRFS